MSDITISKYFRPVVSNVSVADGIYTFTCSEAVDEIAINDVITLLADDDSKYDVYVRDVDYDDQLVDVMPLGGFVPVAFYLQLTYYFPVTITADQLGYSEGYGGVRNMQSSIVSMRRRLSTTTYVTWTLPIPLHGLRASSCGMPLADFFRMVETLTGKTVNVSFTDGVFRQHLYGGKLISSGENVIEGTGDDLQTTLTFSGSTEVGL